MTGSAAIQQPIQSATRAVNISFTAEYFARGAGSALQCTLRDQDGKAGMFLTADSPQANVWSTLEGEGVLDYSSNQTYVLRCTVACPAGASVLVHRIEMWEESPAEEGVCPVSA